MTRLVAHTLLTIGLCFPLALANAQDPGARQTELGSRGVPLITVDQLRFRDLNRDGKLEPYEDWRLPAQQRANDLTGRLSLEEKAGLMMHASAPAKGSPDIGRGTEYDLDKAGELISSKKVATFITRLTGRPLRWLNRTTCSRIWRKRRASRYRSPSVPIRVTTSRPP